MMKSNTVALNLFVFRVLVEPPTLVFSMQTALFHYLQRVTHTHTAEIKEQNMHK